MSGRSAEFSIVMPLYNKEREVGRAVRSVLGQTVADFELIVVDDGSTDESASRVREFADPRIRLLEQPNAGVAEARNAGVRAARGGWVAFLDADDEWRPDFLETLRRLREVFPDAGVLATSYFLGSPDGRRRPAALRGFTPARDGSDLGLLADYFDAAARSDPPICSSAVCVRKGALESAGGFPAGIGSGEDLLTWARLAFREPVAYSRRPGAVFWAPADVFARPGRAPQEPDRVAAGLAELLAAAPPERRKSLRRYAAHWHKMRASIYLRRGEAGPARREIRQARGLDRSDPKIWLYALLLCLPAGLAVAAGRWLNSAVEKARLRAGSVRREGSWPRD